MKIDKLQTVNFMGLDGKKAFEFPNKITVLAAPNGSGKTSVLNAIRFGLTGDPLKGYMVTEGADKCDVGLDFNNGCQIIREIGKGGSPKQWFNKRAGNRKDVEKAFTTRMGVPIGAIRITTASELIGYMKPQALSDFMLKYIPETLTAESILSYVPNITHGMEKYAKATLPAGSFGVDEVDKFYNTAYETRRETKKKKADDEAMLRLYKDQAVPSESYEELKALLNKARENAKALAAYKAAKEAYDKSVLAKKRQQEVIARLNAEIEKLKDVNYDPKETEKYQESKKTLEKELQALRDTKQTLYNAAMALKKAIDTLDRPVCPLSEKLVCTTDKSPVRDELKLSYNETAKSYNNRDKECKELEAKIEKINETLSKLAEDYKLAAQKESLYKQLQQAKEALPDIKEPVAPTAQTINEEEVRAKMVTWENLKKVEECKKRLESMSPSVEDLEALVSAFAPKGVVRMSITSSYLGAFEESCNKKAKELKPEMSIKFDMNGGITPLLDADGSGSYLPYYALSGGEKIYMIFILLDMFNQMCGLKMLFLDELSVLDGDNFEILLNVLLKHTDDYDQVFLTTVDHTDLTERLTSKGIGYITEI